MYIRKLEPEIVTASAYKFPGSLRLLLCMHKVTTIYK